MDELIRDVGELARRTPERARRAVRRAREEGVGLAKAYTPVRTGKARDSIQAFEDEPEQAGTISESFGSELWYFPFIEDGGAHNAAQRPIGRAADEVGQRLDGYLLDELATLAEEMNL